MGNPKLYKRDEVAKENNGETTLMIIHNSVYNVTAYLKEHPGGEEVLLEQGGKDATEAFEDVGHSLDARELMDNYKVGELVPEDHLKKLSKKESWHLDGCVLKGNLPAFAWKESRNQMRKSQPSVDQTGIQNPNLPADHQQASLTRE
uniref:Cytochrome b5 n=1 Tax=Timema cristinae TaxID=61476 RepID=A0A7R9D158_TIMCR|nr:unnamed protein product [Timema cristinae]